MKYFKKLGADYLAAIEGAIGHPLDADYPGKTFEIADLDATLRRFYKEWTPMSAGLTSGDLHGFLGPAFDEDNCKDLHSAADIASPLRDKCRDEPGVYLAIGCENPDRIRSLLMFADAIIFWDPFEESVRNVHPLDEAQARDGIRYLRELRPLIAEGLVVPAQLARVRRSEDADSERANFASFLMWKGVLDADEFDQCLQVQRDGDFSLHVSNDPLAAKGSLGHAENKIASLFLPDITIPLMDFDTLGDYQTFCENLDAGLKSRELEYQYKSLAFETGFLLDPKKLTNDLLLELRGRDAIFAALRETIVKSVGRYEDSVATGNSASFVEEFNIELQRAFAKLKAEAQVSNTWKEYVDESKSFSSRLIAKTITGPVKGLSDIVESASDASITSVSNLAFASIKTYSRYRTTKVLMDFAGAIRENHASESKISV